MKSEMTRRTFVSMAAGMAALPAFARAPGANEKVVVGVMGVSRAYGALKNPGRGASLAIGLAQQPGCEVAYVCDVDQQYLDATRGQAKLNAGIEEGFKSALLCHLGNISYRTGRTIRFDPGSRTIADDPEASKLWSREYRPGWEPKA